MKVKKQGSRPVLSVERFEAVWDDLKLKHEQEFGWEPVSGTFNVGAELSLMIFGFKPPKRIKLSGEYLDVVVLEVSKIEGASNTSNLMIQCNCHKEGANAIG